jgi:hypothetical protein
VSGRQDARFKIEVPVSAVVESWRCVLVQPRTRWNGVDDADDMPWAMFGTVTVRFKVGKARVSKRILVKATANRTGEESLTREEWFEMLGRLNDEAVRHLGNHGIEWTAGIFWEYRVADWQCEPCRTHVGYGHDAELCDGTNGDGEKCSCRLHPTEERAEDFERF